MGAASGRGVRNIAFSVPGWTSTTTARRVPTLTNDSAAGLGTKLSDGFGVYGARPLRRRSVSCPLARLLFPAYTAFVFLPCQRRSDLSDLDDLGPV